MRYFHHIHNALAHGSDFHRPRFWLVIRHVGAVVASWILAHITDNKNRALHLWPRPGAAVVLVLFGVSVCMAAPPETDLPNDSVTMQVDAAGNIELTPEERAWLREHPVIEVVTDDSSAPYQFTDTAGRTTGIISDTVQALERRLGVRFELIPLSTKGFLEAIERGVNPVFGFMNFPGVDPAWPYLKTHAAAAGYLSLFAKDSQERIDDPEALRGATIVLSYGIDIPKVEMLGRHNRLLYVTRPEDEIGALVEGKADFSLEFTEATKYHLRKSQQTGIKEVYTWAKPSEGGFLVRKDQPLLHSIMNKAIADICQNEMPTILDKWYRWGKYTSRDIKLTPEERAWLKNHPVVNIFSDVEAPPYNYVNAAGRPVGIMYDILDIWEQQLGIRFGRLTGSFREIQDMYSSGDVTLIGFAVLQNLKPEMPYTQTDVIVKGYVSFFGRNDAPRIENPEQLRDHAIAMSPATNSGLYDLLSMQNSMLDIGSLEEGIGALLSGRVDYCVNFTEMVWHYLRKAQVRGIVENYTLPEALDGVVFVHEKEPLLLSILNKAIANIEHKELPGILNKWYQWEQDTSPNIELTPHERAWLKDHAIVPMVVDSSAVPYAYLDKRGKFAGYLRDVATKLETLLGIQFSYEPVTYPEIVEHVKNADRDIISGLDPPDAPGADEHYLMTQELAFMPYALFAPEGSELALHGLDAVPGKRIAIIEGWDLSHPALKLLESSELVFGESPLDCINLVLRGEADALCDIVSVINHLLDQNLIKNIRMVHLTTYGQPLVIHVKKELPAFYSALNKALATFSTNDKIALLREWNAYLDDPGYRLAAIDLTREDRHWLNEHPVIRVGTDASWAPLEFRDEQGKFQGVSIGYLEILEKMLGVKFENVPDLAWEDLIEGARKRDIDMFSCMAVTSERREYLDFTKPYLTLPVAIFARSDVTYIGDMDELKGKKVAVCSAYAIQEWLVRDYPEIELVPFAQTLEALEALQRGDVYAFVGSIVTTGYYLGQMKVTGIKVAGNTPYAYELTMAVRNDWPLMAGIIQKALDAIPQTRRNEIYRSWVSVKYEHGFDYKLLWRVLVMTAVVLAAFLYWNRRLQMRVAQQTRELRESNRKHERLTDNLIDTFLYRHDVTGVFTYVSSSVTHVLGYSTEEFLTDFARYLTDHPVNQDVIKHTELSVQGIQQPPYEVQIFRKDGSVRWLEVSESPVRDEDGKVVAVEGVAHDITERKQAEERLKESEKRFRLMYENAQVGWAFTRIRDGKVLDCNKQMARIFGCETPEACIADYVTSEHYVDPDYRAILLTELEKSSEVRDFEAQFTRQDGAIAWLRFSSRMHADRDYIESLAVDITDRKLAEAKLRESEIRFRELFENMKSGVAIYRAVDDGDGFVFVDFNRGGETIESNPRENVIGRRVSEVFPGVKEFGLFEVFQHVWRTGEPKSHPISFYQDQRLSGWRDNYVFKLPSGEIVAIYDDKTEQRMAEEALRESQSRLQQIADTIDDVFWMTDWATHKTIFASQAYERVWGRSRESLYADAEGWADAIHPEDRQRAWETFLQLQQGEAYDEEYRITRPDGSIRWIRDRGVPVFDDQGAVYRVVGIAQDITKSKQAEQEIASLSRFPSENTSPVLRISADGDLLYANDAGRPLLGQWDGQIGQPVPDHWRDIAAQALKNATETTSESQHGEQFFSFQFIPVPEGGYVNVYGHDITDRKHAQRQREALIAELQRKNLQLEQFAYSVSHDLKTPLVTISCYADLLAEELAENRLDEMGNHLTTIHDAGERMGQLLHDLLDLVASARQIDMSDSIPLAELISETIDVLAGNISQSQADIIVPNELPTVRGNRSRLLSVVQNLLTNALKYASPQQPPRIEIAARQEDDEVHISVTDNGIGIDPRYQNKIFELFHQLDPSAAGSGIGLTMVKRIVEEHGGRIWVESQGPGQGTTVSLTVPAAESIAPSPSPSPAGRAEIRRISPDSSSSPA